MLANALALKSNQTPFPWQLKLLEKLKAGIVSQFRLDIPTGLGKTSVMAAWLVARASGAEVPTRLVYVVDRRAVVDQATREAIRLRDWVDKIPEVKEQLGLEKDQSLPISTLRGQFADNGQWLRDPTLPSILVGTVDMIGSRLLFEGYGVSRRMRPYHAGLLGIDTLFVIDEAHLVPPFERLLERVVQRDNDLHGQDSQSQIVPPSCLLSLSATGRASDSHVLQISDDDLQHKIAAQRLLADKRLKLIEPDDDSDLPDRLAASAWKLSGEGSDKKRIIVFCNSRNDAQKTKKAIERHCNDAKKDKSISQVIPIQLFVGARRVRERQMVEDWLEHYGFIAGQSTDLATPAFVIATSAGEVGVDMDADHMVSDLVAFERMIQRFGRVNRRGEGSAEIQVLLRRDQPNTKEKAALKKALAEPERSRGAKDHELIRDFNLAPKYRAALESLSSIDNSSDRNANPEAIRQLKIRAQECSELAKILDAATTPPPLRPELTRPILDSWSMTSLERHPARPLVAPWLRGWIDDEPQTTVVWRHYLPTVTANCSARQIKNFFESAPIHLTEKLETQSKDVFDWLVKRVVRINKLKLPSGKTPDEQRRLLPSDSDIVAIVLDRAGDVLRHCTFGELRFGTDKQSKKRKAVLERSLQHATLVVDRRLGGLLNGLLDDKSDDAIAADTSDSSSTIWIPNQEEAAEPVPAFQFQLVPSDELDSQIQQIRNDAEWHSVQAFAIQSKNEDAPSQYLILKKYLRIVTSEDSRSTTGLRSIRDHHADTEEKATRFAARLGLSKELTLALRVAARNHDHGKVADRWQDAFSAPEYGRPYAKTPGPFKNNLLDGYRHEFGSLLSIPRDSDFSTLREDLQDLVLHQVAAHHGFARPVIRTDSCDTAPNSVLTSRAQEVALRFARLQQQWGPWELAWLESILRAADHRASEIVDQQTNTTDLNKEEMIHG